jgi:phosphatidylglycerophosphate synthase
MQWTPNKVTTLRIIAGFLAIALFGPDPWRNLAAVLLTVSSVALDALDGHLARKRSMATAMGAQLDILGDRMIENLYFTYFAVVGMVSFWLPVLFFARGASVDFVRGLAFKTAGRFGWGAHAMLQAPWARAVVASRWSRGLYAALKCLCFCYLGLELALTRGPVAVLGAVTQDFHAVLSSGAHLLTWVTAIFCVIRGVPVFVEGGKYFAGLNATPGSPGATEGAA